MKVIVTVPGGKDSLAALLWVREHITTNFDHRVLRYRLGTPTDL